MSSLHSLQYNIGYRSVSVRISDKMEGVRILIGSDEVDKIAASLISSYDIYTYTYIHRLGTSYTQPIVCVILYLATKLK